jgi:uncharacterized protein (DUF1330 family)
MQTVVFEELDLAKTFSTAADDGGPVCMLNLLRYRDHADYTGHPDQPARTGREAYQRYMSLAFPIIGRTSVRMIFLGTCLGHVIAPSTERWDDMLLVEYPTRAAFVEALSCAEYRTIVFHRTAALQDSRLIAFRGGALSVALPS